MRTTQPRGRITKSVASAAVLAVFMVLATGSAETDKAAEQISEETSAFNLTADQLYSEYDANQVAADARYKDKVVTVSGQIQNIGKDITDNAYLVIGGRVGLDGVQCLFPTGQESAIAGLSKGQSVVAKGKVSGQVIGNVLLRGCTLQ
jgi:hypothetical protein